MKSLLLIAVAATTLFVSSWLPAADLNVHFDEIEKQSNWQEIIKNNTSVLGQEASDVLNNQLQAHLAGTSPKIADPAIKSIEIIESGEELVDVRGANAARIAMLPNPEKPFATPDHNSGFAAASKMRKTVFEKLLVMVERLDALAPHFAYEVGTIDIKVFEALRDLPTQETLFENKKQEIMLAQPTLSEEQAFAETCKWVSPVRNNIPVHSTGAAVDIRLWDTKNQKFLDMGMFGVIWGKNTTAPTFSAELTLEQKNNRLFMLTAAAQAGLVNYSYEWWHYSCGDRYASYWLDEAETCKACYGPVIE